MLNWDAIGVERPCISWYRVFECTLRYDHLSIRVCHVGESTPHSFLSIKLGQNYTKANWIVDLKSETLKK